MKTHPIKLRQKVNAFSIPLFFIVNAVSCFNHPILQKTLPVFFYLDPILLKVNFIFCFNQPVLRKTLAAFLFCNLILLEVNFVFCFHQLVLRKILAVFYFDPLVLQKIFPVFFYSGFIFLFFSLLSRHWQDTTNIFAQKRGSLKNLIISLQ